VSELDPKGFKDPEGPPLATDPTASNSAVDLKPSSNSIPQRYGVDSNLADIGSVEVLQIPKPISVPIPKMEPPAKTAPVAILPAVQESLSPPRVAVPKQSKGMVEPMVPMASANPQPAPVLKPVTAPSSSEFVDVAMPKAKSVKSPPRVNAPVPKPLVSIQEWDLDPPSPTLAEPTINLQPVLTTETSPVPVPVPVWAEASVPPSLEHESPDTIFSSEASPPYKNSSPQDSSPSEKYSNSIKVQEP
jgi:hypothetical protein